MSNGADISEAQIKALEKQARFALDNYFSRHDKKSRIGIWGIVGSVTLFSLAAFWLMSIAQTERRKSEAEIAAARDSLVRAQELFSVQLQYAKQNAVTEYLGSISGSGINRTSEVVLEYCLRRLASNSLYLSEDRAKAVARAITAGVGSTPTGQLSRPSIEYSAQRILKLEYSKIQIAIMDGARECLMPVRNR